MTECHRTDVRDMLPDLLHGRLVADDRALVERHLAACAACAAELALLGRVRQAVTRRAPAMNVSPVTVAVIAGTRRPTQARDGAVRTTWSGWRWVTAAAAVALLTIGLALFPGEGREAVARTLPLDAHLAVASDAELEAVLEHLESLEATFAVDPEGALTVPLTGEMR